MISVICCKVKEKQGTAVISYLQKRDNWKRDFFTAQPLSFGNVNPMSILLCPEINKILNK